jgi:hypothetical protein
LFVVAQVNLGVADSRRLLRATNGGVANDRWGFVRYFGATGVMTARSGTANATLTLVDKTSPYIFSFTAATNITPRLNGVAGSSAARTNTALDEIVIGGYATSNNAEAWPGEIAEIIAYRRSLSDTEQNQIGNYLANKWGLSWTNL